MTGMTFTFPLVRDSDNSYPTGGLEITEGEEYMVLTLKNPEREVYISKKEFMKLCKFMALGEEPPPDKRDPDCVKSWPECRDGFYDPKCCRFPKSCSCGG